MRIDKRGLTHGKSVTHSDRIVANRRQKNAADASSPILAQKGKRESLKEVNLIRDEAGLLYFSPKASERGKKKRS